MRKYQQKLVLDMLELCMRRHAECDGRKSEYLIEDLSRCREYAVQTKDFIESICGKGLNTVLLLEDYCNLLNDKMEEKGRIYPKALNRKLEDIIRSVKKELKPDRLEIAFFPYKASMADSLESIYLAAKADERCDAYWIPIPYYDKTPEGRVCNVYYEGSNYPDFFEVVDWKTYDTEARHPDVIFIHYPYDACNYVTGIHPDYHSDVLKDQTDLLVYIDYGMPHWLYKDVEKERENILKNHVVLPAYRNCDLYPVYSRKLAETVKLLLQANNVDTKRAIDEKVVALGSPKFDKVLNFSRSEYKLPKQWEDLIVNSDKKVFLFNTSIGSALKDTEAYISRLRKILNVFKNNREILLWWRPHPLMESTFNSMRSEFAAEYKDIVNEFCSGGWGIYDVTQELNRAIAWSDAYYGDESSVVYLYCATGKPFTLISQFIKQAEWMTDNQEQFKAILRWRIRHMKEGTGGSNCCVWWNNFSSNEDFEEFLIRFIHYVVHTEKYPKAGLYKTLQLKLFYDFVENPDGTAGQKIYEYCKQKVLRTNK